MKLIITRTALEASLARATKILPRKSTIPILGHVLLEAGPAGLDISATNLEQSVRIAAQARVEAPGATTVDGAIFYDLVRAISASAEITLQLEGDRLIIKGGRARFNRPTLPVEDYPRLAALTGGIPLDIAGAELGRLIARTLPAASKDETRYFLKGVFFHGVRADDKTVLRAVATNGHVLSMAQTVFDEVLPALPGMIVPDAALKAITLITAAHAGPMRLTASESRLEIAAGDTLFVTKLIDGTFPDYSLIIPSGADEIATADAAPLRSAIERVGVIGRNVKMTFSAGQVALSTSHADTGSADDDLPVDYDGPPLEIGFGDDYLLAMIDALDVDSVRMEFSGPGSPAVFRALEGAPELFVIMPRRV